MRNYSFYSLLLLAGSAASSSVSAAGDMDVKGRLMIDYARYDGVHNEGQQGDDWFVRRARIALDHDSERGWEAQLEVDFDADSNEVDLTDAYFKYALTDSLDVQFGKMKESFGLENTTSSNDIQTLERSVGTDVFSPGRNYGVALIGDHSSLYWQLGIFQSARDENEKSSYAYTLRTAFSPVHSKQSVLHLGLSATLRDMAGEDYEINSPIEISVGDKIIESDEYTLDSMQTYALEGAWTYKRFSVQSEYFKQYLKQERSEGATIGDDPDFAGFYTTLSVFFTDHTREYKNGSFEGFNPVGDEHGVELVARYSEIEILDAGEGVVADSLAVTLNYYLSKDVRLLLETSFTDVESSDPDENGKANATSFRVMYKF